MNGSQSSVSSGIIQYYFRIHRLGEGSFGLYGSFVGFAGIGRGIFLELGMRACWQVLTGLGFWGLHKRREAGGRDLLVEILFRESSLNESIPTKKRLFFRNIDNGFSFLRATPSQPDLRSRIPQTQPLHSNKNVFYPLISASVCACSP